jgi:L-amino acid N-acyltransferase YncA
MEVFVREAMPEDAEGIVAVFNPIIHAGTFTLFDTPFTVEAERSYIASLTARDIFHVAVRAEDNTVVGFQSMSPFATYTQALDHVGVGTAERHARLRGRYVDVIVVERLL